MDEDEIELTPEEEKSFFDGIGADAVHMDSDQIVVEVQETVFLANSDVTVHNFVPDNPGSVIIQDVIENVLIEDVHCSHILEETDISDNVIIPEQVLNLGTAEEVSLAQFLIPDILTSGITSTSLTMPEHVLMSEAIHVSDVGHFEQVIHDSLVETEVITDPITADTSDILVADCVSEAVLDSSGMPLEQQDNDKINCEDYLMMSLDEPSKADLEGSSEVTMNAESGTDSSKLDEASPEVIKVCILKADSEVDELGETIHAVESETKNGNEAEVTDQSTSIRVPRVNIYMSASDSQKEEEDTDNNSDEIEDQNVTASALLNQDESGGLDRVPKQKSKKKKRPESKQYQSGQAGNKFVIFLPLSSILEIMGL